MKKFTYIIILFLILSNYLSAADQHKIYCDKSSSNITYSMNHLLHSWSGVSKKVTSVILADKNIDNISQVAVSCKVSTFDSQNSNRDSHMLEATDALKYPNVTFSSKSIEINGNKLTIKGTLKFHGVSNNISFIAYKSKHNNSTEIKGGFDIKMTDYKIDPPSLMGIATDDNIRIDFDMFFKS